MNKKQYLNLILACEQKDLEKIKKYAIKINEIPVPYTPPLFVAFELIDNLEIINLLLQLGADPNLDNGNIRGNYNPLRYMIGASIDFYKDGFTETPDMEIIKLLIKYGADINKIHKDKKTPLDCAISYKHKEAEVYLRSLGAKTLIEIEKT